MKENFNINHNTKLMNFIIKDLIAYIFLEKKSIKLW